MVHKACGQVECRNDTLGMRVGDSLQCHAWYADAWLTATARKACGSEWYPWNAGMLTHENGMSYIMQNNTNLTDSSCVPPLARDGRGPSLSDRMGFGRGFREGPCPIGV